MDYIFRILPNMFSGLGVSAQIFIFTIVLSLPLGSTYFQSQFVSSGSRGVHLSDARNTAHASDYVHLLRAAFDF